MASAVTPNTIAPASRNGIARGDPGQPGDGDRAGHDAKTRGQRVREFFGTGIGRVDGRHAPELSSLRLRYRLAVWPLSGNSPLGSCTSPIRMRFR